TGERGVQRFARSSCFLLGPFFAGCSLLAAPLTGGSSRPSDEATALLSPEARTLVDRAFEGIDRERQLDVHVHIAGVGAGCSGCSVNPQMRSIFHPVKRLQFEIYLRAAGVRNVEEAD